MSCAVACYVVESCKSSSLIGQRILLTLDGHPRWHPCSSQSTRWPSYTWTDKCHSLNGCHCRAKGEECSTEACGCHKECMCCTTYCNCAGKVECCNPYSVSQNVKARNDESFNMADVEEEVFEHFPYICVCVCVIHNRLSDRVLGFDHILTYYFIRNRFFSPKNPSK